MSKYPVRHMSASRGCEVDIESMPSPHLMNSWRKLRNHGLNGDPGADGDSDRLVAYVAELESRGFTYDSDADRWEGGPVEVKL